MPRGRGGRGGRCGRASRSAVTSKRDRGFVGIQDPAWADDGRPITGENADSSSEDMDNSCDEARTKVVRTQLSVRLCMFEFNQNDSKMDSGSRLVRFGLAQSMRPDVPF